MRDGRLFKQTVPGQRFKGGDGSDLNRSPCSVHTATACSVSSRVLRCNGGWPQFCYIVSHMKTRFIIVITMLAFTVFGQSSTAEASASLERTVKEFYNIQNAGDVAAFEKWSNQHLVDTFSCVKTGGSLASKDAMTKNYGRMISAGGFHDEVSERNI